MPRRLFRTALIASSILVSQIASATEGDSAASARAGATPRRTSVFLGTGGQFLADESSVSIARFGQRFAFGPLTSGWAVSAGVRSPQFGALQCCDVGGALDVAWPLLRTSQLRLGPYVGGTFLSGFSEGKSIGKGLVLGPMAGLQVGLFPHAKDSNLTHTTLTLGYVHWFGRNLESVGEPGMFAMIDATMGFF